MVCVCCVEKNLREDDKDDAEEEDVYFGDQHNGGVGVGIECREAYYCTEHYRGCRMEKKKPMC